MAFVIETLRERLSGLYHHLIQRRFLRKLIPAIEGGHKNEAVIVHIVVVLTWLERPGVADGLFVPPVSIGVGIPVLAVEDPHDAG